MSAKRHQGWGLVGLGLTISVCAFGLALLSAKAGSDAGSTASEKARKVDVDTHAETAGTRTATTTPTPATPVGSGQPTRAAAPSPRSDWELPRARIVSKEYVGPAGTSGGIARSSPPGDPCVCDDDCAQPANPCKFVQCKKDTGTCDMEQNAPVDTRCNLDGLFCTDDRCDATGNCVAVAPRCAKECVGGSNAGKDCLRASDCPGTLNCSQQTAPFTAVCDEANDRCQIGSTTNPVGRCCTGTTDPACTVTPLTETACATAGGKWFRATNPDDLSPCICPKYGSGFSPEGTHGADLGPVTQSPNICTIGMDSCDDVTFCQKRCSNDNSICQVDANCGTGNSCVLDTCAPATPARCNGFRRIGDDYSLTNTSFMRLKQFRFRGGVEFPGETLVFEFYKATTCVGGAQNGRVCASAANCSAPGTCPGPISTFANAFAVQFDDAGIFNYTIEMDCFPNCSVNDPMQSPRDPPFIIPPKGWVVMRSTRDETDPLTAANGHWIATSDSPGTAVEFGSNNQFLMWVDAGPTDNPSLNSDILEFEIIGEKIPAYTGACCDPDDGSCTDTQEWDCRFCQATNQPCSRFPDCGFADFCVDDQWFGPKSHNDFVLNLGQDCADDPCGGACCVGVDHETCTVTDDNVACGLLGGNFLGFGTNCASNCCPQTPATGGDCCQTTFYCSDGSGTCTIGSGPCSDSTGTCQTCVGAVDQPVPALLPTDPPYFINISGTTANAVFTENLGDTCTLDSLDAGWYERFTLHSCGVAYIDLCCTNPLPPVAWIVIQAGCPCTGGNTLSPDLRFDGVQQHGFGANCNHSRCCTGDSNWSGKFTLPAGTYMYQIYAAPTCFGTVTSCQQDSDCGLGVSCVTVAGPYQAHVTVEPCLPAACCVGDTCSQLNVLDCKTAGGFFMGNLEQPVADCFFCTDGNPNTLCPCEKGSCCLGPGNCRDTTPFDTETGCHNQGADYLYVGGARCTRDNPCPVCNFRTNANCKFDNGRFILLSDRNYDPPFRRADDFRPAGSVIQSVCWWPAYLDISTSNNSVSECSDPNGTPPPPPDDFRVVFYNDDFGLPGTTVGPPGGQQMIPAAKVWRGGNSRVWEYTSTLMTPVNVTPGGCYWVEITGAGQDPGCNVFMLESLEGNGYGMSDQNGSYGPEDVQYYVDGLINDAADLAYCISTGMSTNDDCGAIAHPCCVCGGACSLMTPEACRTAGNGTGILFPGHLDCSTVTCPTAPSNDNCSGTHGTILNKCVGGTNPNTPCTNQGQCLNGGTCNGVPTSFDNRCATNDGLATSCSEVTGETGAGFDFVQDLWFDYIAPCSGEMTIDTCSTNTMLNTQVAVYGGTSPSCTCPTKACVGGANTGMPCTQNTDCPGGNCRENNLVRIPNQTPPPATLPACVDDNENQEPLECMASFGRSIMKMNMSGGNCYLVRVGGLRGANVNRNGVGEIKMNITCTLTNPATAVASGQLACRKNRYISFQTNNPGVEVAFEIKRTGATPMTGYAGPPDVNGVSGVYPSPVFRTTWPPIISVGDCEIIPAADYEVRVIPGPAPGGLPTPPLALQTIAKPGVKFFGDTTGGLVGSPPYLEWDCPNGVVNANDFQMALQKFLGAITAPHNTMSNIQAVSSTDPCLNAQTNIADVFLILKAFQGLAYPFIAGTPGNCPPNTGATGQCPL